jgi:hypothetical protein
VTAITTYSTLVQACIDVSEDDSTEYASFLPAAVALAEDRLFKELELQDLEILHTGTCTIGSPTMSKPTGYQYANYFKISTTSLIAFLEKKREDFLFDYWPDASVQGVPKYYADANATQFRMVPPPDLGYTCEIKYTKKPTKLSTSNETNYFTEQCSDILFFATMAIMAGFMKAWTQVTLWDGAYGQVRDTWNINAARKRRDDGREPNTPQQPNTLEGAAKRK